MKIRWHRGGLAESMATQFEIEDTQEALVEAIRASLALNFADDLVQKVTFDALIFWDTGIDPRINQRCIWIKADFDGLGPLAIIDNTPHDWYDKLYFHGDKDKAIFSAKGGDVGEFNSLVHGEDLLSFGELLYYPDPVSKIEVLRDGMPYPDAEVTSQKVRVPDDLELMYPHNVKPLFSPDTTMSFNARFGIRSSPNPDDCWTLRVAGLPVGLPDHHISIRLPKVRPTGDINFSFAESGKGRKIDELHLIQLSNTHVGVFSGDKLFELKATHGLPLEAALDVIINDNGQLVDWCGFVNKARQNGWWDFQTLEVITNALGDAGIPASVREGILIRLKLYLLKVKHPAMG